MTQFNVEDEMATNAVIDAAVRGRHRPQDRDALAVGPAGLIMRKRLATLLAEHGEREAPR
jgi:hypothetical protein